MNTRHNLLGVVVSSHDLLRSRAVQDITTVLAIFFLFVFVHARGRVWNISLHTSIFCRECPSFSFTTDISVKVSRSHFHTTALTSPLLRLATHQKIPRHTRHFYQTDSKLPYSRPLCSFITKLSRSKGSNTTSARKRPHKPTLLILYRLNDGSSESPSSPSITYLEVLYANILLFPS